MSFLHIIRSLSARNYRLALTFDIRMDDVDLRLPDREDGVGGVALGAHLYLSAHKYCRHKGCSLYIYGRIFPSLSTRIHK